MSKVKVRRFPEGKTVSVLTTRPVDGCLDYLSPPGGVGVGDLVEAPLGNSVALGVIWGAGGNEIAPDRLRPIRKRLDAPPMNDGMRRFLERASQYTLTPLPGMLRLATRVPGLGKPPPTRKVYSLAGVLPEPETPARLRALQAFEDRGGMSMSVSEIVEHAGVGAGVVRGLVKMGVLACHVVARDEPYPELRHDRSEFELSADQQAASDTMRQQVACDGYSATLLKGVTGSGKTEVYMEAIAETISRGKQALVLLPEISLTSQFLDRVSRRFGARPGQWHSQVGQAERRRLWRCCGEGSIQLVIGARSALFLPFRQLGLIVVDEEHDISYKQEEGVIYNARDMAVLRAAVTNAHVVLASATPSLESWNNARTGKYQRLDLPMRIGAAQLPEISAVDLREADLPSGRWISGALALAIREAHECGEQALLFLNRRGYAPMTICRKCGYQFLCADCDVRMVEHRFRGIHMCHHCGASSPVPETCPVCDSGDHLAPVGPGVERLAEEARSLFPEMRIEILSSDVAGSAGGLRESFDRIRQGHVDLIIGTQMVAKGHHFPLLTVVGVIDADFSLKSDDFRASERTFQLMTQVAGRSGRTEARRRGLALLQTCDPEHLVMQAIRSGDSDSFLEAEAAERQVSGVPPFGRYVALVVSGTDPQETRNFAAAMVRDSGSLTRIGAQVFGPAPAQIARIRGRFRFRILIKAPRQTPVQRAVEAWQRKFRKPGNIRMSIDVDPQRFM